MVKQKPNTQSKMILKVIGLLNKDEKIMIKVYPFNLFAIRFFTPCCSTYVGSLAKVSPIVSTLQS